LRSEVGNVCTTVFVHSSPSVFAGSATFIVSNIGRSPLIKRYLGAILCIPFGPNNIGISKVVGHLSTIGENFWLAHVFNRRLIGSAGTAE
jgi:hypothetical protein